MNNYRSWSNLVEVGRKKIATRPIFFSEVVMTSRPSTAFIGFVDDHDAALSMANKEVIFKQPQASDLLDPESKKRLDLLMKKEKGAKKASANAVNHGFNTTSEHIRAKSEEALASELGREQDVLLLIKSMLGDDETFSIEPVMFVFFSCLCVFVCVRGVSLVVFLWWLWCCHCPISTPVTFPVTFLVWLIL